MRAREHVTNTWPQLRHFHIPLDTSLSWVACFLHRLYFIGAASVATQVPPHPSPRPVPGGTCWLQNPQNGLCNTRYTASVSAASCFYKRLSRIKWVLVNEVGQCTLSVWRDTPVLRSFFSIHIQVPWTRLSKTATALLVCGMYLQIRGVSVGTVPSMSSEQ